MSIKFHIAQFPMKHKNNKPAKTSITFFSIFLIISIISLSISIIGTRILFPNKPTLHPLTSLTIPEIASIYLPGPYEAATVESSVLGDETIDPNDIVLYINNERIKHGAPPLRINKTLALAAQKRADVILKYQNFAHIDPYEHIQLDTVLPMVHYPFRYASENIGMGDNSAAAFVGGFMSSPSHKANLLNPQLQETGVALVTGAYKQYWVNIAVQLFAIPVTREQYLGYKAEDTENYKRLLNDIEQQLALTDDRLQNAVTDKDYYEGWQKILLRQREILTTLYNTMEAEQPLVKNLISLMREYNVNWTRIPKQAKG